MFIPTEGEDCIFLENAVALIREDAQTVVYYADGKKSTTGFRPETLARRYDELFVEALHVDLSEEWMQEVKK
ncbi:MAG: hypothetical protein SOZ52_03185 [Pyramidobacter sp.]|nr:hypothetical protein [Pyramidobacter sp.]